MRTAPLPPFAVAGPFLRRSIFASVGRSAGADSSIWSIPLGTFICWLAQFADYFGWLPSKWGTPRCSIIGWAAVVGGRGWALIGVIIGVVIVG